MEKRDDHSANSHGDSLSRANGDAPGNGAIPLDWERLARATAHPLRVSIMEILGMDRGRTLSPNELSQELQIPLSNTNYHVTELAKAGLIELAGQNQVRGATEHFYRIPTSRDGRSRASGKRASLEPASSRS